MVSKKEKEMEKTPIPISTMKSASGNSTNHSSDTEDSITQKFTSPRQMLKTCGSPSAAGTEAESTNTEREMAGNELNPREITVDYKPYIERLSMQFNGARKGKQPCEAGGKLGYGIYLADVLNKNALRKIEKNSSGEPFLKDTGTMCRAVVRGKNKDVNHDYLAANPPKNGSELSDLGEKKTKGVYGNGGKSACEVVCKASPQTVHGTEGWGSRSASGYNLYTPLQEWEYLNGLPVDGVKDVKKWAVEVGLADGWNDDMPKKKKFKGQNITEPPKYGTSTIRMTLFSAEDQDSPEGTSTSETDTDVEAELDTKDKGKKKI